MVPDEDGYCGDCEPYIDAWVKLCVRKFKNRPLTVTEIVDHGDEVTVVLTPTEKAEC